MFNAMCPADLAASGSYATWQGNLCSGTEVGWSSMIWSSKTWKNLEKMYLAWTKYPIYNRYFSDLKNDEHYRDSYRYNRYLQSMFFQKWIKMMICHMVWPDGSWSRHALRTVPTTIPVVWMDLVVRSGNASCHIDLCGVASLCRSVSKRSMAFHWNPGDL